VKIRCRTKLKC